MENTLVSSPAERTAEIHEILNSLRRYDVTVLKDLEDYVKLQCEKGFSDVQANLALLKLYEFASEPITEEREESTINVLLLGLSEFYNIDFELYLHLLPSYSLMGLNKLSGVANKPEDYPQIMQFVESVVKIKEVYNLLTSCKFTDFWALLNSNESYQDLILSSAMSDLFESKIRDAILKVVYKGYSNNNPQIKSSIKTELLKNYLNLYDNKEFEEFIAVSVLASKRFTVAGDLVLINQNTNRIEESALLADGKAVENSESSDNKLIATESVKFDSLSRLVKDSLYK